VEQIFPNLPMPLNISEQCRSAGFGEVRKHGHSRIIGLHALAIACIIFSTVTGSALSIVWPVALAGAKNGDVASK
jgi:hypothetical protein